MIRGTLLFVLGLMAGSPPVVAQVRLEFGLPSAMYVAALQLRSGNRLLVGTVPSAKSDGSPILQPVLTVVGGPTAVNSFGGSGNAVPRVSPRN